MRKQRIEFLNKNIDKTPSVLLKMPINWNLIHLLIKFSKILHKPSSAEFGISLSNDIKTRLEEYKECSRLEKKFEQILLGYTHYELACIYAFYEYGDVLLSKQISLYDLIKGCIKDSKNRIIDQLLSIQTVNLEIAFSQAKERFYVHEGNVKKHKTKFAKRLKSFNTQTRNQLIIDHRDISASTNLNVQSIIEEYGIEETTDIELASQVVLDTIKATNGALVVDFLGGQNMDNLDFVEHDKPNGILKLYWKYSNVSSIYPPHNKRVDIKFDKLKIVKSKNLIALALKGFYQTKSEITNYYASKEKVSSFSRKVEQHSHSHFYYSTSFDRKVENGKRENFEVDFLPWRYFNILILPRESIKSVSFSTQILKYVNLQDAGERIQNTYDKFISDIGSTHGHLTEDDITMYGNRFRKIIENLLKFICLSESFMFIVNYKTDLLGKLLENLKYNSLLHKIKQSSDQSDIEELEIRYSYRETQEDRLYEIINDTELMLNDLNFCSHENVSHLVEYTLIVSVYKQSLALHDKISSYLLKLD